MFYIQVELLFTKIILYVFFVRQLTIKCILNYMHRIKYGKITEVFEYVLKILKCIQYIIVKQIQIPKTNLKCNLQLHLHIPIINCNLKLIFKKLS